MTAALTENQPATAASGRQYHRRRRPFGAHVAWAISQLQHDYLARKSDAIAVMARLRTALGRPPGDDYSVLHVTQVPVEHLGDRPGDAPTFSEQAKHTALALYALHQQSIYDKPMHRDGPGLGSAINSLSRSAASSEAVRRRFGALGTVSTFHEAVYHLRGLVRQMRVHRIAMDYGLLADDLLSLQLPNGRAQVRGLWGRDFYRTLDLGNKQNESEQTTGTEIKE